jgi:nicotinate-nucleotide adenylyltransferase
MGLYGGSFDPPHRGHAALARAAVKELKLDRLFIVPASLSPHKQNQTPAPARHRLAMARLAFKSVPRSRVIEDEIRRRGVSYTVDTLRRLRKKYPAAQWRLVAGEDSLAGFPRWKSWRQILSWAPLAVGRRRPAGARPTLPAFLKANMAYLRAPLPAVASRDLRSGASRGLVPVVRAYIERHRLYGR